MQHHPTQPPRWGSARYWAPPLLAGGSALVCGQIILRSQLARMIETGLASLSFDAGRIALIEHAAMTAPAAGVAALLTRRRIGAWLGAMLFFTLTYLAPFVSAALHPLQPVAGIQVRLLPDALRLVTAQLFCLGGVMAASGAAIGATLAGSVTLPLAQVAQWLFQRLVGQEKPVQARLVRAGGALLTGAA
ncbi:MAG TPA: hypothetical protein VE338_01855, partial [Ktedonobacterales bacterium]|nr:hypothetical protein [Ktedonobacterales bacterium]